MKNLKLIALGIIALAQVLLISAMSQPEDEKFLADVMSHVNKLKDKHTQKIKDVVPVLPYVLVDMVMQYSDVGRELIETYNLYNGIANNNIAEMKKAIENGADINLSAPGDTALIKVIKMFDARYSVELFNFIKFLVSQGANVSAKDLLGNTSLMLAVKMRDESYRTDITQLLLRKLDVQQDINIQNYAGETALMFAASSNDPELVNMLIQDGADQTIINNAGQTAYSYIRDVEEVISPIRAMSILNKAPEIRKLLNLGLKKEQELANKKRELERVKEIEQKRMQETSKKQEKINEKLSSLTSEMIKQQYSKNTQKREELQRQKEEERLRVQRAEEALAQMAAQPQEENWGDEPVEGSGEAEEDWGELEQED